MALNQINLDSIKFNFYNITPNSVRQGEKGIILPVGLTSNNVGVNNLNDVDLSFEATKPDKKIILDEDQTHFKKYDGYFEYTLPTEIYQAVGDVTGHFILKYDNQVIDTTSDFSIKVLPRTGQDEYSSDYISQAEKIVEYAKNKLDEINKISKIGTSQIELTKDNLTKNVNDFIESKKNNIDSNLSNYYAQLNQLINTFKTNINANQQQFTNKKNEIDNWFSNQQSIIIGKYKQIESEWNEKKAEKDTDFKNLKISYDNQIANLTKQYQNSVDEQKTKLSNDLNEFKNNLKNQVSDLQNTIKNLNENRVPELNDRLSKIQKAINDIDLESVKARSDNAYTMANGVRSDVDKLKNEKAEKSELDKKADLDYLTKNYWFYTQSYSKNQTNAEITNAKTEMQTYTDNKVANAKPDLSNYYSKQETYNREQIDNKNLASQQQATTIIKQEFGDKANLNTEEKSNLVSAINWLWSKINGAFDLSSPVIPYVNDSANYTNQNMIYLNNSQSYNFDSSHTITYDSNFADSKLSNIGDGLKLWVKLRKKAIIKGVQQADNNDYPVSYSSSDYVSGQYSTSVQSPIIINKSDIAVNSSSESKIIIVELSGVGEMQTGSKLAPKLKITNRGDSNALTIESIQGYNFDNPNSSQVTGAYYDLDVDRVANFELVKTPVKSLVSGTVLVNNFEWLGYNVAETPKINCAWSEVGDGILIKFDALQSYSNSFNNSLFSNRNKNIVIKKVMPLGYETNSSFYTSYIEENTNKYIIKVPKSQLIKNNVLFLEDKGDSSNDVRLDFALYSTVTAKKAGQSIKINDNSLSFKAESFYSASTGYRISEIVTYKNNVLFDGGYKIGKSTNDVTISKKLNELKNGLIIKIDKLKLETIETNELTYMQQAFKPSDDVQVSFEENPNQAILTIPKDKIAVGKTLQTANAGTYVRDGSNYWLYASGNNQRLNINFKNDTTLNFSAGLYNSNDSAIFISEIQEY